MRSPPSGAYGPQSQVQVLRLGKNMCVILPSASSRGALASRLHSQSLAKIFSRVFYRFPL
jgi:hypothetical protein